jgi:hypothetical protein
LKLLQSEGELTMASTAKDEASGTLMTRQYTLKGPVMLMLTTTAIDVDEEVLTLTEGVLGTLRNFDKLLRFLSRRHAQLDTREEARRHWEQQLRAWELKREETGEVGIVK